jgi:hypothetical protein
VGGVDHTVAAKATPATWAPGCNGEPNGWSQRPSQIGLTCDSVAIVVGLRWRDWGDPSARATGVLNAAVSCTPNCAEAPRRHYAVGVVASHVGYCGTRRVYGEIVVHYTAPKMRGRKPVTQPTFCSYTGQRPTSRPTGVSSAADRARAATKNAAEFYAPRRLGMECGMYLSGVHCQSMRTRPYFAQVADLQPDGAVTLCATRRLTSNACDLGNAGERTPMAGYGKRITVGPFRCQVLHAGVRCTVISTGKGFLIETKKMVRIGHP